MKVLYEFVCDAIEAYMGAPFVPRPEIYYEI